MYHVRSTPTNETASAPLNNGVLQRHCTCGLNKPGGGECTECHKQQSQLLREASNQTQPSKASPLVTDVINSPGQPLDMGIRLFFGQRFAQNFSHVRIHTDTQAGESARRLNARAYTVGNHVAFGTGEFSPNTNKGTRLLAHELAHTVQQAPLHPGNVMLSKAVPSVSTPVDPAEHAADNAAALALEGASPTAVVRMARSARPTVLIQRDINDPERFRRVHSAVFPQSAGGTTALLPWQDPGPGHIGTEETLYREARPVIVAELARFSPTDPARLMQLTTESDVDVEAIPADARIHTRFPMIPFTATPAQLHNAVNVLTLQRVQDRSYQQEWLANRLIDWSSLARYRYTNANGAFDTRFVALLDRLLNDRTIGRRLQWWAGLTAGITEGSRQTRRVFINFAANQRERAPTIIHELIHFYVHVAFQDWALATRNDDLYTEGITEYLARLVMNRQELAAPTVYGGRLQQVQADILNYIPEDDIARAYFLGEVWRIETRSAVARREAGSQLGLGSGISRGQEIQASRTGPGINQTVVPGQHYRFMNLGIERPVPKPEHVTFFRQIKHSVLDPAPALGVRFVGHASTPGPSAYNLRLSEARSRAFYQLAQNEGMPNNRLIDLQRPPHMGERRVTAREDDPVTRAFNRRVEMTVQAMTGGGS